MLSRAYVQKQKNIVDWQLYRKMRRIECTFQTIWSVNSEPIDMTRIRYVALFEGKPDARLYVVITMEEETKNKAVKTIYVVYALDYSYKESENIDKRDLTQYVCRVFTRMADAEQYIMDFFKKFAADDATLSITKTKNGFMLAELKTCILIKVLLIILWFRFKHRK